MNFLFASLVIAFIADVASASAVQRCDVVSLNNAAATGYVYVEVDRAFLELHVDNEQFTLLADDFLTPYDAQAIWYNRKTECKYTKHVRDKIVHQFDCGDAVRTVAEFAVDSKAAIGSYSGKMTTEGSDYVYEFSVDFRNCR